MMVGVAVKNGNVLSKIKKHLARLPPYAISMNRWEPENGMKALKTGLLDAVQVIYNIFNHATVDQLFPLCKQMDIATIARVPFDKGTLTGTITKETTFAEGDWRGTYFVP